MKNKNNVKIRHVVQSVVPVLALGGIFLFAPLDVALTVTCMTLFVYVLHLRKRSQKPVPRDEVRWRDMAPCYLTVQDRELRILETNALFRSDFGEKKGSFCYQAYKNRSSPCPNCPVLKTFEDGQTHFGDRSEKVMDEFIIWIAF